MKKFTLIFINILFICKINSSEAQSKLSINEILDRAVKKSSYLRYYYSDLERQQFRKKNHLPLSDPLVSVKIFNKNFQALSIKQDINIANIYLANSKYLNRAIEASKNNYLLALQTFKKDVLELYLRAQYLSKLTDTLKEEDEIINEIIFKYSQAKNKLSSTDSLFLDNITKNIYANYLYNEINFLSTVKILKSIADISDQDIIIEGLQKLDYPEMYLKENIVDSSPEGAQYRQSLYNLKIEKLNIIPNIFLKFNHIINGGITSPLVNYFEVGLSVPLFFGKYSSAIKQANTNVTLAQEKLDIVKQDKWKYLQLAIADINSIEVKLNQADNVLLDNAKKMIDEANKINGWQGNNLLKIIELLDKAFNIRISYIIDLYDYNKAVINAKFINNSL